MIVTDIQPYDKKRSRVYVDGTYAFLLYKGEIREFSIKSGEELRAEDYDRIMKEILPLRCKKRAMHLLEKRDYTEYKLREKLREGEYPTAAMDEAIDYVKSYHYLDDERYARDYATYQVTLRSRRRIEQDLMQKGIDKGIIASVLEEIYAETDSDVELNQARKLLEKRHYSFQDADRKEQQKQMAFLLRKGYSMEVVQKALSLDTEW